MVSQTEVTYGQGNSVSDTARTLHVGNVFPEHIRDPDEHLSSLLLPFDESITSTSRQHKSKFTMDAIMESGRKIWEGEIVKFRIAGRQRRPLTAPRTLKVNVWSRCFVAFC
jgi:hypothetical protein